MLCSNFSSEFIVILVKATITISHIVYEVAKVLKYVLTLRNGNFILQITFSYKISEL